MMRSIIVTTLVAMALATLGACAADRAAAPGAPGSLTAHVGGESVVYGAAMHAR